ncbi:MAG: hypothetical protein OEV37_01810 [Candidatus Berkelbacteria bacterium]|nr:hypothetical protein [Candidatus Berkelbacteria bacterium]
MLGATVLTILLGLAASSVGFRILRTEQKKKEPIDTASLANVAFGATLLGAGFVSLLLGLTVGSFAITIFD